MSLKGRLSDVSAGYKYLHLCHEEYLSVPYRKDVAKSKWSDRSRGIMNLFLSAFTILPFDREDALWFGRLRAALAAVGTPVGPYDIQIAAQGVSRGLTVITHNIGEFSRVPNLKVEDWVT